MPAPPFQHFDAAHSSVLILTIALTAAAIWLSRKRPEQRLSQLLPWILGGILLLSFPLKAWAYHVADPNYPKPLPMHMCDWAAFLCVGAMWRRSLWMAELAYFWGIGGTLQGILTPNLAYGFPHPMFFAFFALHSGVVICALYTVWGLQLRPRPHAFIIAWASLHIYMAAAIMVNAVTGANFGFLRAKPDAGSLFDLLGPWPWYILALEPIVFLLFALLAIPFYRTKRNPI